MEDQPQRKLAVILHADVVGSTQLVQKNETLAHQRIRENFQRLAKVNKDYGGATHEIRGDALVAEFNRASDAVSAAINFQHQNKDFNSNLDDGIHPELRIGISMGEVIIADNTVTGAGVVIAQRLEQLAEPGGICIQSAAQETVPQRLPFDYKSLGEQNVKGFEQPVRAFHVSLKAGAPLPGPESASSPNDLPEHSKRQWLIGIAFFGIFIVGALATWLVLQYPEYEPASVERMQFALPDRPSIAVLPFQNMSDSSEQEYFADGITDDLITDLSKISDLFVIARNSVFFYKNKQVKIRDVAEDLGVRYVLEGSVRRSGGEVRINAQLIDATTGGHLWAERYDGNLEDIFRLQDQVTEKIVSAMAVNLTGLEISGARKIETESPEAYEAFLRGWEHYQRQTRQDFSEALQYLERAVELDRDYSRAYAALATLYWEARKRDWLPALRVSHMHAKERALEYRDLAMSNPSPLALVVTADILMWHGKHDDAITQAKRAIQISRNDAHSHLKLAEILAYAGSPQEALKSLAIAKRLDPYGKPRQLFIQGLAEFGLDQFKQAASSLEEALELNPGFAKPTTILAASYGHLGQHNAAAILKPHEYEYWASSVASASIWFPFKREQDKKRFAEGLRKAGLQESG